MASTTSNLPICIHCGTARPADETNCPSCGQPWIDVRITTPPPVAPPPPTIDETDVPAAAAAVVAAGAIGDQGEPPPIAISDTGEFGMDEWTLPPEPPKSRAIWLLPVALFAAVAAFWGFVWFGGDSSTTTTIAAVETTTTSSTTTTTTTIAVVAETSTTTSSTTTTTVPWPPADAWEASGTDLPTTELPLKAAGVGPLAFGQSLEDVAGQLITSLGTPDAAGDNGVCSPEEVYWLQWGPFRAVFDGWDADAAFVSYRNEVTEESSSQVTLRTLSGLELGQTVEQLRSTYNSYTVTFEVIDGTDHFRLVDGGELLLWGPVSSTDDAGEIIGIYSPSPCPAS